MGEGEDGAEVGTVDEGTCCSVGGEEAEGDVCLGGLDRVGRSGRRVRTETRRINEGLINNLILKQR